LNSEIIASLALLCTLGGALITFGIMYGSLKKEQESFKESFKEFKQEIKDDIRSLRKELRIISQRSYHTVNTSEFDEEQS